MKLKNIASNVNEIVADNGLKIMFSYETPVAGYIENFGFFKTTTNYSVTTTKHINKYLREELKDNANFEHETINEVPQELINSWVNVFTNNVPT